MKIRIFAIVALLAMCSSANAADSQTVTGLVTNVDTNNQTITVLNEETRRRGTYFVTEDTRVNSDGQSIDWRQIKRGNFVVLRYNPTDTGREIVDFDLPNSDEVRDITPVENTGPQTISGKVMGVREMQRTVTIREDATRQLRTLTVPESVMIYRDDSEISLAEIKRGDDLTAKFRMTESGPTLVDAKSSEMVAFATTEELPKTAGTVFVYLFMAIGFLFGGFATRHFRKKSVG